MLRDCLYLKRGAFQKTFSIFHPFSVNIFGKGLPCFLLEKSRNATRISEADIREYYKEALRLEAQALINYLIKEIVLYDDKIEIYFNKPTRTSPDENRGFSFYTEVVNMPTESHATRGRKYKRITLQMLV